MQYMVLKPKPMPIASTATTISTALMAMYDTWAGIRSAVAYWMMVQRPIIPPADIPLGIMKHSQAAAKMNDAMVRIRYSLTIVSTFPFII